MRAGEQPPSDDPGLAELRRLLLEPERSLVRELGERLSDQERRARDLAEVLDRALMLAARRPELARVLAPLVERALLDGVRRQPQALVEILVPTILPAIRAALRAMLAGMVESLNTVLERSFSLQGLRWRVEAAKSGKSFAEVALIHSLVFRVEQLFLIHADSGLLLAHRSQDPRAQDPALVSAMLTAIQDFVRDSFRVGERAPIQAVKMGELELWVEPGKHALLAALIRGQAPAELRGELASAQERIHRMYGAELAPAGADPPPGLGDELEPCLLSQLSPRPPVSWARRLILASVVLGALALAGFASWRWWEARQAPRRAYLAALARAPGVVVLAEDEPLGLYDPLGVAPERLAMESGLPPERSERFVAHSSPDLALTRFQRASAPPPGVTASLTGGVLSLSGEAPAEWLSHARALAPLIPGIGAVDAAGMVLAEDRRLEQEVLALGELRMGFALGSHLVEAEAFAPLVRAVRRLDRTLERLGRRGRLVVQGQSDARGTPEQNAALSTRRARAVVDALGALGLDALELEAQGLGVAPTATSTAGERAVRLRFEERR